MNFNAEPLVARRLSLPMLGVTWVKYPGWYARQAMKAPLRGPFAAFRPLIDELDRFESDTARDAIAKAGLPEIAVIAVTEEGLEFFRATEIGGLPKEKTAHLSCGSFGARSEDKGLLVKLHLRMPSGRLVQYETTRYGLTEVNARGVASVVAAGRLIQPVVN